MLCVPAAASAKPVELPAVTKAVSAAKPSAVYRAPMSGFLNVRLRGRGDWDLLVPRAGASKSFGGSELGSTINVPPLDLRKLGADEHTLLQPLALAPKGIWLGPKELRSFYQIRQSWAGKAVLPGDYDFNPGDQSVRTFRVTFRTEGDHRITVTDTANPSITGSAAVEVAPARPTKGRPE